MPLIRVLLILLVFINASASNKIESSFNCDYEIDLYNCVNINCKGFKHISKIPLSISNLVNFKLKKNQLLCSVDFSDTGIEQIDSYSMENINELYDELISFNLEHNKNVIKILLSNIKSIESFRLANANIVLLIRDSHVKSVEPKSLKSSSQKVDISLINTTLSGLSWFNLLDSTSLRLFSIRSIPNLHSLNEERVSMYPITTITDLKIYNSYLPVLEDNFFMFKILKYVEQIEITNCSISIIRDRIFNKITFSYLRMLSLANNNLTHISVNTFTGLNELVMLDLDENPIQIIEANSFDNLKQLKSLSINNNIKLINLIQHSQFNNWFNGLIFNYLIKDTKLMEISLKNKLWIEDFCLIQDIFLRLNKNLISNNLNDHDENSSESNAVEPKTSTRKLYLFNEDQIDTLISNVNYCNIKFICANLKNLYWRLEVYNLCIRIKTKKTQIDCLYYKMSYECSLSLNSGSHASKYELASTKNTTFTPHATENCLNSSAVYAKIKWISFTILAIIIFLILLTLVFFYYSFKSSKTLYEECEIRKSKQQSTINPANTINRNTFTNNNTNSDTTKQYGVNNSEYYVLLVNKNSMNCN